MDEKLLEFVSIGVEFSVVEYFALQALVVVVIATGYRTVVHGEVGGVVAADYPVVGQRSQHQELPFVGRPRQGLRVHLEAFVSESVGLVVPLPGLFVGVVISVRHRSTCRPAEKCFFWFFSGGIGCTVFHFSAVVAEFAKGAEDLAAHVVEIADFGATFPGINVKVVFFHELSFSNLFSHQRLDEADFLVQVAGAVLVPILHQPDLLDEALQVLVQTVLGEAHHGGSHIFAGVRVFSEQGESPLDDGGDFVIDELGLVGLLLYFYIKLLLLERFNWLDRLLLFFG